MTLAGCIKPDPPRITAESLKVTTVSLLGLQGEMKLQAENPNSSDLDADSVVAHVVVGGDVDMGTVTIPHPVHLPAKKKTEMTVPLEAKWPSLIALVPLAQKNQNIPFTVDGKVKVGGTLSIDVPFHLDGWLTHDQLVKIAASAIPKIPGLPL